MNPSTAQAHVLVDELVRGGLRHVVVAPGSRSAPLALALYRHDAITVHVEIDERSAGFLALGIARVTRVAAAVLCTSGTAAANLLPAVIEAAHADVALLVLTADRPPELRDTGANQTIDQVGLYGTAVRWHSDLAVAEARIGAVAYWRSVAARALAETRRARPGPVHLNIGFRDPLAPDLPLLGAVAGGSLGHGAGAIADDPVDLVAGAMAHDPVDQADDPVGLGQTEHPAADPVERGRVEDPAGAPWIESLDGRADGRPWTVVVPDLPSPAAATVDDLAATVAATERGALVIAGDAVDPVAVAGFAEASGWPVLAEPLSGARSADHVISTADLLLAQPRFASAHRPDHVVVVGRPVLTRGLRAWLDAAPVVWLVDAHGRWLDPGRSATHLVMTDPSALLRAVAGRLVVGPPTVWLAGWQHAERAARAAVDALLDSEPTPSEPRTARDLAAALPNGALLAVASSMPVRDLSAVMRPRVGLRLLGNRGASGIDGFVSTTLGAAVAHAGPVVALVGDLSMLHDQNGFLLAGREALDAVFVVLNNDGGGIFSMLEYRDQPGFESVFATPHDISFATLAATYGLQYHPLARASDLAELVTAAIAAGGVHLIEVRTDREANRELHVRMAAEVAAAIRTPS